jgi:hypothetical protein
VFEQHCGDECMHCFGLHSKLQPSARMSLCAQAYSQEDVGCRSLAASGELGQHPKIYVWDTQTCQPIKELRGIHRFDCCSSRMRGCELKSRRHSRCEQARCHAARFHSRRPVPHQRRPR